MLLSNTATSGWAGPTHRSAMARPAWKSPADASYRPRRRARSATPPSSRTRGTTQTARSRAPFPAPGPSVATPATALTRRASYSSARSVSLWLAASLASATTGSSHARPVSPPSRITVNLCIVVSSSRASGVLLVGDERLVVVNDDPRFRDDGQQPRQARQHPQDNHGQLVH